MSSEGVESQQGVLFASQNVAKVVSKAVVEENLICLPKRQSLVKSVGKKNIVKPERQKKKKTYVGYVIFYSSNEFRTVDVTTRVSVHCVKRFLKFFRAGGKSQLFPGLSKLLEFKTSVSTVVEFVESITQKKQEE